MARISLFLLACLVVIAVASAAEEDKETSDLTETNFDVLERVARDAEPRRKKGRKAKKGNRKGKNAKKEKGKRKGNKKGGRKNGRSAKKGKRKAKSAKKAKKSKGKRKGNKKSGKGNRKSNSCRQVATDDACITNICAAWKMRNGPVRNFIRQTKRMVNHAAISEKKLAKKAEFDNDAATLESVLGGNASAPSCALDGSGSDASSAAVGLKACNADIVTACPPITVDANFTGEGGCNKTMFEFKAKVEGCGEGADAASCACYATAVAMKDAVVACAGEAKTKMTAVKKAKDVCKKKFGACKSLQDKSVGFAATCHKGGKNGKKTTSGVMATGGATGGMRRNRILRQLMEQNMKRQAKLNV